MSTAPLGLREIGHCNGEALIFSARVLVSQLPFWKGRQKKLIVSRYPCP